MAVRSSRASSCGSGSSLPPTKSENDGPVLRRSLNAVGFFRGWTADDGLSVDVVAYALVAVRKMLGRVAAASRQERHRYPEMADAMVAISSMGVNRGSLDTAQSSGTVFNEQWQASVALLRAVARIEATAANRRIMDWSALSALNLEMISAILFSHRTGVNELRCILQIWKFMRSLHEWCIAVLYATSRQPSRVK